MKAIEYRRCTVTKKVCHYTEFVKSSWGWLALDGSKRHSQSIVGKRINQALYNGLRIFVDGKLTSIGNENHPHNSLWSEIQTQIRNENPDYKKPLLRGDLTKEAYIRLYSRLGMELPDFEKVNYKKFGRGSTNSEKCLDYLQVPNTDKHREVKIDKYYVDGLLDKDVYEFFGDFWHANPLHYLPEDIILKNPAKDKWEKDKQRAGVIKSYGYNFNIIWESDWTNFQQGLCEELRIIKF